MVVAAAIVWGILWGLACLGSILPIPPWVWAWFHGITIDKVQSFTTIAAILVGAIWTWMVFVRTRQRYPRANIKHCAAHWAIAAEGKVLLRVTLTVSNIGDILLQLRSGVVFVRQAIPPPTKIIKADDPPHVGEGFYEYEWPRIGKKCLKWEKGKYEIEPRESDSIACDFIILADVETVVIYSHLENETRKRDGSELGWSFSSTHDLTKGGSAMRKSDGGQFKPMPTEKPKPEREKIDRQQTVQPDTPPQQPAQPRTPPKKPE